MGNVEDLGSFRAPSPAVESEEGKVLVLVSEVFNAGSGLNDEKDETIGVDTDVVTVVGVVVAVLEESVVSLDVGVVVVALEVTLLVAEVSVVVMVALGFVVTALGVDVITLGVVVFVILGVVIKGDVYN